MTSTTFEELADYRRRVAGLYADAREAGVAVEERCARFRRGRDELFRTHSQSALSAEQKGGFTGLEYFAYDPALRFLVELDPAVESKVFEVDLPEEGLLRMERVGLVRLTLGGQAVTLTVFWLLGYGGGLFLPFRDATNDDTTYGGGRYLLDTIKYADLGTEDGKTVIDFNFAYNPSCAYNSRWVCPLAPFENRLGVKVEAGEKKFAGLET